MEVWSELVKQNPNLHLLLVGPRYDQTQKDLKAFNQRINNFVAESGKSENIHFLGKIDCVDMYLKVADIFIFPSEREGMPNAVLEAMSTALPIVLTPFVGLSEELGKSNENYLLTSRRSDEIKKAIQKLLDNRELRSDLSTNARDWIVSTMSINSSVREYAHLYKSIG